MKLMYDVVQRGRAHAVLLALLFLVSYSAAANTAGVSRYILGPGDLIQIQVYGEDDLTVKLRVDQNGILSYPFLGDIPVKGRAVDELQQSIDAGLRGDYLINPDVRVYLLEARPVYVNGEVRKPGGYPYVPGLTVQKAIALAGGFTELASERGLYLVREADEQQKKIEAGLNMNVGPGDTLIVEERFF